MQRKRRVCTYPSANEVIPQMISLYHVAAIMNSAAHNVEVYVRVDPFGRVFDWEMV